MIEKHSPSGSRQPGVSSPVEIFEIGGKGMPVELIIRNGKIYVYDETGQTTIDGGIIQAAGIAARAISTTHLSVGASAFTHNITHYAINWYQVYFYSGTIYWANGESLTTSDGYINALTVIYLYVQGNNPIMSASSNHADAVGTGKTLIAIITPGSGWGKYASVQYQNGAGTTIDGDLITTGTINAQKLNVVSINAAGYINATYINAGTLAVGGSGSVSPSALYFLDSSNNTYGAVNTLGIIFLNSKGILLHNVDQSGNPASFNNDSSNRLWVQAGSANKIYFADTNGTGQISMDLATKVIRCDGLGSYYLVGGTTSSGSVITHNTSYIRGDDVSSVLKSTFNFELTYGGFPFVDIVGIGTESAFDYFDTGFDAAYELKSGSTAQEKLSMGFKTGGSAINIDEVDIVLSKQGTPAGNIYVDIYADSGGVPTGSAIGSSDGYVANTAIYSTYSSFGWVNFHFSTPVSLSANTNYHAVLRASGYTYSAGATAIWLAGDGSTPSHANGYASTYNSGTTTWSAISGMAFYFVIFQKFTDVIGATDVSTNDDHFYGMAEDPTTNSCIAVLIAAATTLFRKRYFYKRLIFGGLS